MCMRESRNIIWFSLCTIISTCKNVHVMPFVTGQGKGMNFLAVPALVGDPSPFFPLSQLNVLDMWNYMPHLQQNYMYFFCPTTFRAEGFLWWETFFCCRKQTIPQNYIFTLTEDNVNSVYLSKPPLSKRYSG